MKKLCTKSMFPAVISIIVCLFSQIIIQQKSIMEIDWVLYVIMLVVAAITSYVIEKFKNN